MPSFEFERFESEGVFTYRYVGDGSLVERSWPGIVGDWPEGLSSMSEFNINNNNREEVAVYLGFVWKLREGLSAYAIPSSIGEYASSALGAYDLVKWDFRVEVQEGPELGRVIGFLPPRTSTHWEFSDGAETSGPANSRQPLTEQARADLAEMGKYVPRLFADEGADPFRATPHHPPDWQPDWDSHAALYPVKSFAALRDVQATTLADAASTVTIFGAEANCHADLVHALRAESPPRVADLIAPGELLVSLNLGIDIGYFDVLLVQSTSDIGETVDLLAANFQERIGDYEASVDEIADVPGFLAAVNRFAGVSD